MNYIYGLLRKIWHLLPLNIRMSLSKVIWNYYKLFRLLTMPKPINIEYNNRKRFYIIGFFGTNLSHKTASDLLVLEFEKKGFDYIKLDISDIHLQTKKHIDVDIIADAKPGDNIVFAVNPDILPMIYRAFPKSFFKNKYLIGYWVYELDKLPIQWQIALTKINELWVPSSFVKKTIQQYSDIKIKIVPHAVGLMKIDLAQYDRGKIRKELAIEDNVFIALTSFSFSSSMERKNIIGTIKAFEMAFGTSKKCLLLIRYINQKNFPESLQKLEQFVANSSSNIKLLDENALGGGVEALFKLYTASDVLLSLHRSEGFGLQIAEAMRFNLPVIATNYSGNTDFMNEDNSISIDYKLVKVFDEDNIYNNPSARWAEPSLEQVSDYLNRLYNNQKLINFYKMNMQNNRDKILTGSLEI